MPAMPVTVRPARPEDLAAARLLYASAEPYYDAFAGSGERALRLLARVWTTAGHTAAYDQCHVAELDGEIAGVIVVFRTEAGDRLARRFLRLAVVRLPVWQWPGLMRHLRASATVIPQPRPKTLYVDALAVDDGARRRGVGSALIRRAEEIARQRGLRGVSLDTGLQNAGAQAFYEGYGFRREGERRASSDKIARAIGGPGFISYYKAQR